MNVDRPFPWTSENMPYVRCLLGMINQALGDMVASLKTLKKSGMHYEFHIAIHHIGSGRWLMSDNDDPLSCRWCCEMLGYDHGAFKRQLMRNWRVILTQKKWCESERTALAILESEDDGEDE